MSTPEEVWVGIDPGGAKCFGVAILNAGGECHTRSVNCVDEAIRIVRDRVPSTPAGVGVDAPLWWSSGPAGCRKADQWIRQRYQLPSRNVQSVNSMWGAVIAQGMMFVARIRELFPNVPVTEAHPKAVLVALGRERWTDYFRDVRTEITVDSTPDHERDAVIAALAAREGFQGRWTRNLALDRLPSEQHPGAHWLAPVQYYWPE